MQQHRRDRAMAVAVRHENIRGAGCQRALDGGVDFQRGELAAALVVAGFREAVIRRVYHPRHTLHVRHHVDFHRHPQDLQERNNREINDDVTILYRSIRPWKLS